MFNKNLIINYKQVLLSDFQKNKKFSELLNTLFFNGLYSTVEKWVNGINGNNFIDYEQKNHIRINFPTIETLRNIDYTPVYYRENEDRYCFFTKKIYNTYEEAVKNYPGFYYCFDLSFFKKINTLLLENFEDYTKRKDCYIKKLSNAVLVKLFPNVGIYKDYSSVQDYNFPKIIIEVNEEKIEPFLHSDLMDLLFLTGESFLFFSIQSNIIEVDEQTRQISKLIRKEDEPIIYENNGKYIVTNSIEKLECYNKYIYVILDLYYHYFRLFENWISSLDASQLL